MEPQDAYLVSPIIARCDNFIREADGGFVVEATTIMDPAALAHNPSTIPPLPMWGERLRQVMSAYRYWARLSWTFSSVAIASRGLMEGDAAAADIFIVLGVAAALTAAVFAPLTTRLYRAG